MKGGNGIIGAGDLVLVTGAGGFIGCRVVAALLARGIMDVRCLIRSATARERLEGVRKERPEPARLEVVQGNLLSRADCAAAVKGVAVVLHLAAGRGEKLVPDAFLNSVVTTRNLLEACYQAGAVRRFVNVSSFSVYSNRNNPRRRLLDETCPVEEHPELRGDAYTFAKVKQDALVVDLATKLQVPYVLVRPGVVYGPGNATIHGRVGISTFGLFLHLGGWNLVPFTYVDNCADAIVLAGSRPGIEKEVFNVVDDALPSSRQFLSLYKRHVRRFKSIYLPHAISYLLCYLWEKYSAWSEGQLPPIYGRRAWHVYWKRTRFSNDKLKTRLGWQPVVSPTEALARHFEGCKLRAPNA